VVISRFLIRLKAVTILPYISPKRYVLHYNSKTLKHYAFCKMHNKAIMLCFNIMSYSAIEYNKMLLSAVLFPYLYHCLSVFAERIFGGPNAPKSVLHKQTDTKIN